MTIGSISIGKRKCITFGGKKTNKTRVQLKYRVSKKYRLQLLMDGKPYGGYQWTSNKRYAYNKSTGSTEEIDTIAYADIPSDGRNHTIALKDIYSTEQSSETSILSIGCAGGVIPSIYSLVEDPATNEKRYTVELFHEGTIPNNLTGYVYLNGKTVGSGIVLKPRQKAYREVVLPATGLDYIITSGFTSGRHRMNNTLWFVDTANLAPVTDPGIWTSTTTFNPGETVVIGSAVGEEPLETDGSEWILLEYSPAAGGTWNLFGEDGLVEPDDDGTWAYEVETGSGTTFPASTSWKVRATRYKDYRESSSVEHTFSVGATPHTPPAFLKAPSITGPKNKTVKSGSRVTLSGTGPPGARLYFERRVTTAWGSKGPVPRSCTVNKAGRWKTTVSTTFVDNNKKKSKRKAYKRVAYSCRAKLNGRYSGWSSELTIRWNRKK